MACENDVRVQNEYAVRCTIATKPVVALEYVKSISSLVGASHILAVFEETDYIKVFFDDKQCVDTLMRNCLHVLGRHINVDYVIPPGMKLIMSNVDPVITNYDIIRILSSYGTVVSPVIRPPISDDVELCHISYGVRFVYVVLNACIPDKIEFRYGNQLSSFKVHLVEPDTPAIPFIKPDTSIENHDEIESNPQVQEVCNDYGQSDQDMENAESVNPVLVSVESVTQITSKEHVESFNDEIPDVSVSNENTQSQVGEIIQRRGRGRPRVITTANRKRLTTVSHAARRIKISKRKWFRGYKKEGYKHRTIKKSRYHTRPLHAETSIEPDMPDLVKIKELNGSENSSECNSPRVLTNKNLLKYIDEVKGHRAPLELARKYVGEDCDSEKLYKLIDQLNNFKRNQENLNLKTRIWRLNKTLTDALNAEKEN